MPTVLRMATTRSADGRSVLTATGEIDLSNVEPFSQALLSALAEAETNGKQPLVVDLSAVEYLDSAAVNVLFPHAERLCVIAHPFLVRVFNISGFAELADIETAPARRQF